MHDFPLPPTLHSAAGPLCPPGQYKLSGTSEENSQRAPSSLPCVKCEISQGRDVPMQVICVTSCVFSPLQCIFIDSLFCFTLLFHDMFCHSLQRPN